jgi:hypothetical protein
VIRIAKPINMKLPFSESGSAARQVKLNEKVAAATPTHETTYVQLDDFLQVEVVQKATLRSHVRTFLTEHCSRSHGISFVAGRGKLIAEMGNIQGQRLTFGEVVKHTRHALDRSDNRAIRGLDAREMARVLCVAAVDVR